MPRNYKKVTIENAELKYLNFSGRQTDYNPAGMRNFCVVIPPENVNAVREMGYNVKTGVDNKTGDEFEFVKVNVSYRFEAPRVEMIIANKKRVSLTEDSISQLDGTDFESIDLSFTGSDWENRGKHGTSAYLDSLYALVKEDYLDSKYSDIPYAD